MATKKTSTKAKTKKTTKTTKASATRKAAAKTTKATTKAKAAKKATATTAKQVKKTTKQPKTKKQVTFATVRKLHIVSAVILVLLAVLAAALMSNAAAPISISYLAKDELASQAGTVFSPASQALWDVQIRWLVVSATTIAALFSVLLVTKFEKRYQRVLQTRVQALRWIDFGIIGALIVSTIALLSGVTDFMTLKLVGGLMVVTAALGWIAERQNADAAKPVWGAYVTSLVSGALPWLLIGSYAVATWVYGFVRYPWYVYALYAAALLGFITLAVAQAFQHRRRGVWATSLTAEKNYTIVRLVTVAAFAAILILGFQTT